MEQDDEMKLKIKVLRKHVKKITLEHKEASAQAAGDLAAIQEQLDSKSRELREMGDDMALLRSSTEQLVALKALVKDLQAQLQVEKEKEKQPMNGETNQQKQKQHREEEEEEKEEKKEEGEECEVDLVSSGLVVLQQASVAQELKDVRVELEELQKEHSVVLGKLQDTKEELDGWKNSSDQLKGLLQAETNKKQEAQASSSASETKYHSLLMKHTQLVAEVDSSIGQATVELDMQLAEQRVLVESVRREAQQKELEKERELSTVVGNMQALEQEHVRLSLDMESTHAKWQAQRRENSELAAAQERQAAEVKQLRAGEQLLNDAVIKHCETEHGLRQLVQRHESMQAKVLSAFPQARMMFEGPRDDDVERKAALLQGILYLKRATGPKKIDSTFDKVWVALKLDCLELYRADRLDQNGRRILTGKLQLTPGFFVKERVSEGNCGFRLESNKRVYTMRCDNKRAMAQWMDVLQRVQQSRRPRRMTVS
jgi:hypothetical protein